MVALTTQVMPLDSSRLRLDATFPLLRKRLGVICAMPPNRLPFSGRSLGTAVGTTELRWWWWWFWKKPWLREAIDDELRVKGMVNVFLSFFLLKQKCSAAPTHSTGSSQTGPVTHKQISLSV